MFGKNEVSGPRDVSEGFLVNEIFYEVWRKVPGWPEYEVSNKGRVRREGRILKAVPVQSGSKPDYRPLYVSLSARGKRKDVKIGELVLRAFVRRRVKGDVLRHLDDDLANNTLHNLCWGTHAQNGADRKANGLTAPGELNGNATLTWKKVLRIRGEYVRRSKTHGLVPLAEKYGVSVAAIHNIIEHKTWKGRA